jgi:hypothetical protein
LVLSALDWYLTFVGEMLLGALPATYLLFLVAEERLTGKGFKIVLTEIVRLSSTWEASLFFPRPERKCTFPFWRAIPVMATFLSRQDKVKPVYHTGTEPFAFLHPRRISFNVEQKYLTTIVQRKEKTTSEKDCVRNERGKEKYCDPG